MQHLAVRVKPISFALRACCLGHYRMARMSQSASPCGLASWMSPQMIPDTHLLKLLFLARYYLSLNLLAFLSISVVLRTCFLDLHCCNILLRRTCFPSLYNVFRLIKVTYNPYWLYDYTGYSCIITVLDRVSSFLPWGYDFVLERLMPLSDKQFTNELDVGSFRVLRI